MVNIFTFSPKTVKNVNTFTFLLKYKKNVNIFIKVGGQMLVIPRPD
ncbi:hypothetical protein LABF186_06340 [Lactobacillus amylovorus subsp. animalium]|uniref:Uncharacterized protein n=1 Tax=Lactobacillus amylovorus subsp. animalium TaxID=3378536 RepID=A0ABD0C2K1_LACAM|nr:hypothetical protein LABF186_06340 [Lactobacillus amylovorus]GMM15495.1 hypothetical protein LABF125_06280 [Lactobacillus amylovorus]